VSAALQAGIVMSSLQAKMSRENEADRCKQSTGGEQYPVTAAVAEAISKGTLHQYHLHCTFRHSQLG